jgi:hypothetical protein
MDMARLEIPVSGWTCLRTGNASVWAQKAKVAVWLTLVDVGAVGLLAGLGALLLLARWSGSLLSGLLGDRGLSGGGGLATGGWGLLSCLWCHFDGL